jgi:hypothetical protein
MENANHALLIAGGTLIGIILIAALVAFARNLNVFPSELDKEEQTEQIQAFNAEYEAYNKKIMYGADLISVLNKAKSNNEKYVKGSFLDGQKYTKEYVINIKFNLKSDLEDRVTVSYLTTKKELNADGTVKASIGTETDYTTGKGVTNKKLSDAGLSLPSTSYSTLVSGQTNFLQNSLVTNTYKSTIFKKSNANTYYQLCAVSGEPDIDEKVNALLNAASEITQKKINSTTDMQEKLLYNDDYGNTKYGWSSVEWKTCLYDLKSRKFKCVDTTYNENTGRIVEMVFEEY